MKPLSLKLKNIGAFAGEALIDFTQLNDIFLICGKTGSAEIDGQENTNAWFVGFLDDPNAAYALAIVVEDAGGGGSVAAPLARQIFSWMLANAVSL